MGVNRISTHSTSGGVTMGQHSDPGGYPCHNNAMTLLAHYQGEGKTMSRPHVNRCGKVSVQNYWIWRMEWIDECLRHVRLSDMSRTESCALALTICHVTGASGAIRREKAP